MEKRRHNTFTYTWVIENVSMFHPSVVESLCSPYFTLPSLPNFRWYLDLYMHEDEDQNYTAVYLNRCDDFQETCCIKFNILFLDSDDDLISVVAKEETEFVNLSHAGSKTFERQDLFTYLINDTLIIKCNLEAVLDANKEQTLPSLPYKDTLFADVVLRAGDAVYSVHKAVLSARWPKLVEKLEAQKTSQQVMNIRPDILKAMIEYVYTGKLDCSKPEMLVKLYAAAAEYELNLQDMAEVERKVRTCLNVQQVSFQWAIENFDSLPLETGLYSQVFSVRLYEDALYRWILIFHRRKEGFDISICKIHDKRLNPIFVKSKIVYEDQFQEKEYVVEKNDIWKCAEFPSGFQTSEHDTLVLSTDSNTLVLNTDSNTFVLSCQFAFSDGNYSAEMTEISCAFMDFIFCYDFVGDLRNLYDTGKFSDVDIKVGSKTLFAHKFILSARSAVFSRMFETKMIESEKNVVEISDIDPDIMEEFLIFMYCGYLIKPLEETAGKLYAIADKYDVSALQEKCSSFLQSNLDSKNVIQALRLADMYRDDELYQSVLEFTKAHAENIFKTDEWKESENDELVAKLLQDISLKK